MGEVDEAASRNSEHWVTSARNRLLKGLSNVSFGKPPSSWLYVKVKTWPSRATGLPTDDDNFGRQLIDDRPFTE
jgi:hypothetical protein